jgi:hypothetical protein
MNGIRDYSDERGAHDAVPVLMLGERYGGNAEFLELGQCLQARRSLLCYTLKRLWLSTNVGTQAAQDQQVVRLNKAAVFPRDGSPAP